MKATETNTNEIFVFELKTINKNTYWKHTLYPDETLLSEYIKSKKSRGNCSTETIKEAQKQLTNKEAQDFKEVNKDFLAYKYEL